MTIKTQIENIKFNVGARGRFIQEQAPCILTLQPGQTLSHDEGGPTEEGWSHSWQRWSYDGQQVTREYGTDGTDCDGRLTTHGLDVWDLFTLNEWGFPEWERVESRRRDFRAEEMGY